MICLLTAIIGSIVLPLPIHFVSPHSCDSTVTFCKNNVYTCPVFRFTSNMAIQHSGLANNHHHNFPKTQVISNYHLWAYFWGHVVKKTLICHRIAVWPLTNHFTTLSLWLVVIYLCSFTYKLSSSGICHHTHSAPYLPI